MRRALGFTLLALACHRDAPAPATLDAGTAPAVPARVVQLAVGADFACGLDDRGRVRCFGSDKDGALGVPGVVHVDGYASGSGKDVDVGGRVASLAAGLRACAILDGGKLRCWGANNFGELGYRHRRAVSTPAAEGDVDVGGPVEEIALGANHTCARLASGDVRCWGEHMPAPFAKGQTPSQLPPIPLGGPARAIAAAGWEACALLASGVVKCWGESTMGGHTFPKMRTIDPHEPLDTIVFADAGLLATTPTGDVARFRETLDGAFEKLPSVAFDAKVRSITPGSPCVLFDDGRVRCFGSSERLGSDVGLLGVPGVKEQSLESKSGRDVDVGGRAKSVGASDLLRCALREDGRVLCWGMVDLGDPPGVGSRMLGVAKTPSAGGPLRVFD